MLAIRLVQWLGWVFETQERKKERCGPYTFNSFSLALWRSRNQGDLFGSWKIDVDKSCNQLLKLVLRYRGHLHEESFKGIFQYSKEWKSFTIIQRDFSIFEGMKKFYYRHSVKKCTKYPFDTRAHLKTVRRLWFPTSDRLEIWLILSGTIRSKQYHESTMVWHNLPLYHLW